MGGGFFFYFFFIFCCFLSSFFVFNPFKKLNIPQKNGQYTSGKNDLFAVMLALRYLIDNEDFKKFKRNLLHIINNVLKKCPHLSKEQLLNAMGFPESWDKILRYRK